MNTKIAPPEINHPAQPLQEIVPARAAILKELLPYDYQYALDSGLVDLFFYDPKTGEDGLLHTLGGNLVSDGDDFRAEGFHHEPSGAIIWPSVRTPEGGAVSVTRVDRSEYPNMTSKERRDVREYPMEPHLGHVVINGIRKYALHTNPQTGERLVVRAKNSMFPKEYDALAVMQAVRLAYKNRDPQNDIQRTTNRGEAVVLNDSWAPMIDGKTPMGVRLVMDKATGKVLTATPLVKRGGSMRLTEEQVKQHLFGS